jgi:hypothetical protein
LNPEHVTELPNKKNLFFIEIFCGKLGIFMYAAKTNFSILVRFKRITNSHCMNKLRIELNNLVKLVPYKNNLIKLEKNSSHQTFLGLIQFMDLVV